MKMKIKIFVWWLFWVLYLELIYRIAIFENVFTLNILTVALYSLPWIMIISFIVGLFNEKWNKILTIIFSIIGTVFTLAQIVYYNFYNSIFSFFSLTTGTGQVMQFWQQILHVIGGIWYIFALILIPFILFLIFNRKIFSYSRNNKVVNIALILFLVMSLLGITSTIVFEKKTEYSFKKLFFESHAPMLTIERTGLFTMEVLDVERYIFGFEEKMDLGEDEPAEPIIVEPVYEPNVLNIDFDKLIEKTTNKKVLQLHKYFKTVEPTYKNEYTGLFKDKNLIFITAEGFDAIAVDENITPTLYKMANNGYVFKNYYQPLFTVSTSDGEYMNLTSLVPKEGVWSFKKSGSISMPFGYGNMFKRAGYISYGFHNHNYKYYGRNVSHPNIGLKYIACGNGLQKKMNCSHWPNSDYEMIQATTDYYLNKEKPFATYYMTVSGHLNYNFYGNNMAYRNKDKVKNLKYSEPVRAYYATQIELDKAMTELLKRLEAAGKLNDTLIVICPDHYPYGLTKDELNEVSPTNRKNKFENYHTTLIMYNPTIETQVIDKVVSSLDIIPTLYNLYGLDFDSRLFMGRDIFSDQEHIVILSDRSWVTDKGKYNSVNKKFTKTTTEELEEGYIEKINKIVNNRFQSSASILDNNYYAKLGLKWN